MVELDGLILSGPAPPQADAVAPPDAAAPSDGTEQLNGFAELIAAALTAAVAGGASEQPDAGDRQEELDSPDLAVMMEQLLDGATPAPVQERATDVTRPDRGAEAGAAEALTEGAADAVTAGAWADGTAAALREGPADAVTAGAWLAGAAAALTEGAADAVATGAWPDGTAAALTEGAADAVDAGPWPDGTALALTEGAADAVDAGAWPDGTAVAPVPAAPLVLAAPRPVARYRSANVMSFATGSARQPSVAPAVPPVPTGSGVDPLPEPPAQPARGAPAAAAAVAPDGVPTDVPTRVQSPSSGLRAQPAGSAPAAAAAVAPDGVSIDVPTRVQSPSPEPRAQPARGALAAAAAPALDGVSIDVPTRVQSPSPGLRAQPARGAPAAAAAPALDGVSTDAPAPAAAATSLPGDAPYAPPERAAVLKVGVALHEQAVPASAPSAPAAATVERSDPAPARTVEVGRFAPGLDVDPERTGTASSRGIVGESPAGGVEAALRPGVAVAAEVQPAEPVEPTDGPRLAARLAETVQRAVRGGAREFRMQLHPPELGRLEVRVLETSEGVRVTVAASSLEASELIRQHLPLLRSALESRDLRVDRLDVFQAEPPDAGEAGADRHSRSDRGGDGEPVWSPLAAMKQDAEPEVSRRPPRVSTGAVDVMA